MKRASRANMKRNFIHWVFKLIIITATISHRHFAENKYWNFLSTWSCAPKMKPVIDVYGVWEWQVVEQQRERGGGRGGGGDKLNPSLIGGLVVTFIVDLIH